MSNSCETVPNGDLDGLLRDLFLPSTTRIYQYQGKEQFHQLLRHLQRPFLDHPTEGRMAVQNTQNFT